MEEAINGYGDKFVATKEGFGVDISSQRADDLDNAALQYIEKNDVAVALDVGCGLGAQAARMACAGAKSVIAIDKKDYSSECDDFSSSLNVSDKVKFIQTDVRDMTSEKASVDLVCFQRTIHYMPFSEAKKIAYKLSDIIKSGGRLFISASGLHSELAKGYSAKNTPISDRFAYLSDSMAEKHNIKAEVCLYSKNDLRLLLSFAGFKVDNIYESSFGNIKAEATRV